MGIVRPNFALTQADVADTHAIGRGQPASAPGEYGRHQDRNGRGAALAKMIKAGRDRGCSRMCWSTNMRITVCHEHTNSDGGVELCER